MYTKYKNPVVNVGCSQVNHGTGQRRPISPASDTRVKDLSGVQAATLSNVASAYK